jgi:hypothetical protein
MPGPEIWGPNIWQTLHFISLGYPNNPSNDDKEYYRNFFLSFKHVLPCKICSIHYAENLKKYPLTDEVLSSKNNLILWVIDTHNAVNESNKKPIIRYDNAINMIIDKSKCNHFNFNLNPNPNSNPNQYILYILFIILAILIIIAILYKKIYLK